jgi:L-alanine-DL-glutamate epimerase-like enolase superfamily enzyme
MTTRDGLVGYGEAATLRSYFNQTLPTMVHWLEAYASVLIGLDPASVNEINRTLDRVSGAKAPGTHPARAAVEMALYDILGKAHGCPVYDLLGGALRTELEMITQLYTPNPEDSARTAEELVDSGFRALKVKIGIFALEEGLTQKTIRQGRQMLVGVLGAVPDDVYVDADANQGWANAKQVVQVVESVLRERFYSNLAIEQPLHHLDLTGHAFLRRVLPIPVILDESVVSPEAMLQIARMEAADRIVLKLNRVGGLTKARQIVAICEAASIGISLDTMPFTKLGDTALCHLGATIRDPYPVDAEGHTWFEETPFSGGIEIRDGLVHLSPAPGYGVELDEAMLERLVVKL